MREAPVPSRAGRSRALDRWDVIAQHLFSGGRDEILAKTLVVIVTFIPFFGFWEIDRVLGHGKLSELFFHKRTA